MIHEHFRATGACEAVQGLTDLFNIRDTAEPSLLQRTKAQHA